MVFRKQISIVLSLFLAVLLVGALGTAGCTQSPSTQSPTTKGNWKAGESLTSQDYKKVTRLILGGKNEDSGEDWSASFSKKYIKTSGKRKQPFQWVIDSAPGGQELIDPLAHSGYIEHILDAIFHLKFATRYDGQKMSSKPKDDPWFLMKWQVSDSQFTLWIGKTHQSKDGRRGRLVQVEEETDVFLFYGGGIGVISKAKNFDSLRHPRLSTWKEDRVAQFEILNNKKAVFFAERLSGRWGDRKSKIIPKRITHWLKEMLFSPITRYLDNPSESAKILGQIHASPDIELVLKDRRNSEQRIFLKKLSGQWFGASQGRPDAAFQLNPESEKLYSPSRARDDKV